MTRIPIATQSASGRSKPLTIERLVNMYAEAAPSGSRSGVVAHGCPGVTRLSDIDVRRTRGLWRTPADGRLYVVVRNTLYHVSSAGVATGLGTIAGSGRVGMADNGTQLCIVAGVKGYTYSVVDGLEEITDESFPGATTVTYMDGYFVFNNPNAGRRGQFFISSLLDGRVFDATDFATAENYPDNLLRVFADHSQVLLFGSETVEPWFNAGNADFPFAPSQGSVIEQGLGATWSVAKLDETVVWLADDGTVRRLAGSTPLRISTHAIEFDISQGDWQNASAWSYSQEGHQFYVLTVPAANTNQKAGTYVYDAATQLWHDRKSYRKDYCRSGFYARAYGKHITADIDRGRLYEMSLDVYDEDGEHLIAEMQLPQIQNDGKRFIVHSLQLDMEVGVPSASPSVVIPAPEIAASANGGYSSISAEWTYSGEAGDTFELHYDTAPQFSGPTVVNLGAGEDSHLASGLTRGQIYYFRVRAVRGTTAGDWSATDSATVFQLSGLYDDFDPSVTAYQDAGVTPVTNGSPVQRIVSATGSGRYIESTGSNRPTWIDLELNGRPVVRSALGNFLRAVTASDWKFLHDGTECSAYVVYKINSSDSLVMLLDTGGLSSTEVGFGFSRDDRSSVPRSGVAILGVSKGTAGTFHINSLTTDESVSTGAWHISAPRVTSLLGENRNDSYLGGYSEVSKEGTPSASDPQSALTVGARYDNTFNLEGDWARVILVSGTISDSDHMAIQDYLSEEYGIFRTAWFNPDEVLEHDAAGMTHNGWPGIGRAQNGDLIVGYSKETSHTSHDGQLIYRFSTDDGSTWGDEIVLWDYSVQGGGTDFWFTPRFTTLSDGRILMATGLRVSQSPVVGGIGYFESNDNGVSWSGPTQLTEAIFTSWSAEAGGIIELANGNLLYPYYGKNTADASNRRSAAVLVSSDSGATWSALATIASGPADVRDWAEPGLVQIGNGNVLALLRDEDSNSCHLSTSTDNGATWSSATYVAECSGLMNPLRLSTGEIISIQRDFTDASLDARILFSPDDGATWQLGHKFPGSPNFADDEMLYGQFQEGDGGEIHLVYGTEDFTSFIADVMFAKTI